MNTAPTVIDALLTGLRARPALADVIVSDGMPTEDLVDRRLLTVGGQDAPTAEGGQEWGALGNSRRVEDYVLRLYASAVVGGAGREDTGNDQKAARDAAFSVVSEVAAFLRADPSLGGLIVGQGAEMGSSFSLTQTGPDTPGEGRWAEVAFDVRVRARV